MNKTYPSCYKKDTAGKTRIWFMEQEGSKFRTHAGIDGGSIVVSDWTQAEPTNVGRSNERDAVAQTTFEIEAAYKKKLSREYHDDIAKISAGAHFFKPMLANPYKEFKPGFAQPKLDGVRCITKKDGMFSREGKPINSCPHIMEVLAPVFAVNPGLVLDGECYNHDLKDDFNTIVSLVKKQNPTPEQAVTIATAVQYHVYDMPSHDGPFSERDAELRRLLVNCIGAIQLVETRRVETEVEFDTAHGEWLELGYEGSMWRKDAKYDQKRSSSLLKRKDFQDAEYEVVAIEEGLGNWAGAAKRVICKLPDGRTFGAGIAGTYKRGQELMNESHKIVTVKFFMLTPDGIPRFGVATKFHGEARVV